MSHSENTDATCVLALQSPSRNQDCPAPCSSDFTHRCSVPSVLALVVLLHSDVVDVIKKIFTAKHSVSCTFACSPSGLAFCCCVAASSPCVACVRPFSAVAATLAWLASPAVLRNHAVVRLLCCFAPPASLLGHSHFLCSLCPSLTGDEIIAHRLFVNQQVKGIDVPVCAWSSLSFAFAFTAVIIVVDPFRDFSPCLLCSPWNCTLVCPFSVQQKDRPDRIVSDAKMQKMVRSFRQLVSVSQSQAISCVTGCLLRDHAICPVVSLTASALAVA